MVEICKDREGLRHAALEMLDEMREQQRERDQNSGDRVDDRATLSPATKTRRTLSPGYYMLLGRVMDEADAQLKAGIPHSEIALDEDDLLAWSILEELCAEFVKKYPACSMCGAPLRDWQEGTCAACGEALKSSKGRKN